MRTFASFDWHGPDGMAHTCAYRDRTPILTARGSGGVSLHLTPADERAVTVEEVRFARELAKAAAVYADECERYLVEVSPASADRGAA
jgi:hypothetical protein